ncbi:MAG TPA: protein kinase [Bryobacteraceae bacterium]|nr:protein kinase [Bryobacteraceae bacterium]
MIGQRLLHYEIVEKLGEGGMGIVYKARDTHLGRFVAVKVLPPGRTADASRRARFVQEAKAASALNHPNIVVVHDIAADAGVDFIVMEYVAGKTLGQLIPRKGMRLGEVLKIGVQVAEALARAHSAGIVHRDLKPANLMVDEHGLVKVLDFGLAKLAEAAPADGSTATIEMQTEEGSIVGTTAYMSPEQGEGKPVGPRSDIFSLGSVLYEMLTGQPAFRGESKISTLAAVLHQEPAPLPEDFPKEVARIVSRCLRKDPARRFQHMDDVQVALRELQEESDSGKLPPQKGPAKGPGWKWVAGCVLGLVLLLAAGWFVREAWFKPAEPLETSLLTSLPGNTKDPAFSPDGRQVAFSWNGEKHDKQAIYLKLIGSPTPRQLSTGAGFDDSPAFSPDGLSIAFIRWMPEKAALVMIPAIGGPERTVLEQSGPTEFHNSVPAPYISWFPDGKNMVTEGFVGLVVASVETGEMRPLTTTPAGSVDINPAVSPDGKRLAFVRAPLAASGTLYVLDLTEDLKPKTEPRRLTPANTTAQQPAWTPDGRNLVFSSGRLWVVPASGSSPPRRLPLEDSGISSPTMPRQGRRLVYRRSLSSANIWRIPLTGPEPERIPQRLIASTRTESGPDYSPDGTRIAFASSRTGASGIWVSDADGSNAVELYTPSNGRAGSPNWSPDGQLIAFDLTVGDSYSIYTIAARGGKPTRVADGLVPRWSRDGEWIYFGTIKNLRLEVSKAPKSGGPPRPVTTNGGHVAMESTDGKFVYYTKTPGNSALWRAPVDGGGETQVLPSVVNWAFRVAESGIYFAGRAPAGDNAIQFLNFASGQVQLLTSAARPGGGNFSVSPDGRFALYTQREVSRSELMLVENFR